MLISAVVLALCGFHLAWWSVWSALLSVFKMLVLFFGIGIAAVTVRLLMLRKAR